jgi:hypothetical protein
MGHADNAFRQDQQRVAAGDPIIGLGSVIGIPGAGKAMNAPGCEGEAFAIGEHEARTFGRAELLAPPPPPHSLAHGVASIDARRRNASLERQHSHQAAPRPPGRGLLNAS